MREAGSSGGASRSPDRRAISASRRHPRPADGRRDEPVRRLATGTPAHDSPPTCEHAYTSRAEGPNFTTADLSEAARLTRPADTQLDVYHALVPLVGKARVALGIDRRERRARRRRRRGRTLALDCACGSWHGYRGSFSTSHAGGRALRPPRLDLWRRPFSPRLGVLAGRLLRSRLGSSIGTPSRRR